MRYCQSFALVAEKLTVVVIEVDISFVVRAGLKLKMLLVIVVRAVILEMVEEKSTASPPAAKLCFQGLVLRPKRDVVAQKVNCRQSP